MSEQKVVKTAEITIKVGLDDKNHPVNIKWNASDDPQLKGDRDCKGMFVALFETDQLTTATQALWTPTLQVAEMDRMMYQTLCRLADTYYQSTKNGDLANNMRQFAEYFGQQTEVIPK